MIEDVRGTAPEFSQDEPVRPHLIEDCSSGLEEGGEIPAYYKRRSAGIWTCLATLAVAVAAAAAYGYFILREQNIQLAELPGVIRSLPELHHHIVSTENLLQATRVDQDHFAAQLRNIDAGSKAALVRTREQMTALVAQSQSTLLKGVNQRAGDIQAQLSQLASQQSSYQLHVAELETELVRVRTELATARRDYSQELAAVRDQQGDEGRRLEAISSSLPTRQVFFEIQKNQPADIAPGVSFHLRKTDVGHQRFDGWIEAALGHEKVLVQNQEVRSPVMFFPSEQGKAFLMVATRVDQQGVGGYFLVPASSAGTDQAEVMAPVGSENR